MGGDLAGIGGPRTRPYGGGARELGTGPYIAGGAAAIWAFGNPRQMYRRPLFETLWIAERPLRSMHLPCFCIVWRPHRVRHQVVVVL